MTKNTIETTMNAVTADHYGSLDVLSHRWVDRPSVGADEVLIRVVAAGMDRAVWHLMTGRPYVVRVLGFGLRRPANPVLGLDVSGHVEAVGDEVTRFAVGDEVFGIAQGSFAEFATAKEIKVALKPSSISFEQAAAVAISGLTALQGLRDAARLREGQSVLVIGASGGVGTWAVQIAAALGATVTGVCSAAKADLVRSLGADDVIDYRAQDITASGRRFDVILDLAGNRPLKALRRLLAPEGTLVIGGGEGADRLFGGIHRQMGAVLLSPFVKQHLTAFVAREHFRDMMVLAEMIEAGQIAPVVSEAFPLTEVKDAMRHMLDGHARGTTVISVSP